MKSCSLVLAVSLLLLVPGCRKSEIDEKPAAEVSATSANVIKEKSRIDFVGAKVTRDHNGEFKNFDGRIEYDAAVKAETTPEGVRTTSEFTINRHEPAPEGRASARGASRSRVWRAAAPSRRKPS